MKKAVMEKWVKALRSGKYKQGKHVLRNAKDEYCCLGVLCEVLNINMIAHTDTMLNYHYYYGKGRDQQNEILPKEALKLSGIKHTLGQIEFKKGTISLSTLNDTRGRNFKQIAAYIERNWRRL